MKNLLALLLLFLPLSALGAALNPEATADNYFRQFDAGNWEQAAAFYSPSDLSQVRSVFTELVKAGPSSTVRKEIFGNLMDQEIAKLTDTAFAGRVIGVYFSQVSKRDGAPRGIAHKVLGSAMDGEHKCYVVARITGTIDDKPWSSAEMISLSNSGSGWRVPLPEQIAEFISSSGGGL